MHKCDNRQCVNPEHLILGTNKENTADMRNKGRGYELPIGERSHVAKFSDEQIAEMRAMAIEGTPYREIAASLDIHESHVSRCVRGLSRISAGGPVIERLRRRPIPPLLRTEAERLRAEGMKWSEIADVLGYSRSAIGRLTGRHMKSRHPDVVPMKAALQPLGAA
jgi:DNA invertase Pin-like site-specific DNA recombinase